MNSKLIRAYGAYGTYEAYEQQGQNPIGLIGLIGLIGRSVKLLKYRFGDFFNVLGFAHRVVVQHGSTGGHQFTALVDGPLGADLAYGGLVLGVGEHLACQLLGDVTPEGAGQEREVFEGREGLQSGDDRDGDSRLTDLIKEIIEKIVIKKHLCCEKIASRINLFL